MIFHGDCREIMAGMDAESVDAIVTDPPYGIHFMGKTWDKFGSAIGVDHKTTRERSGSIHAGEYDKSIAAAREFQAWCESWSREALRVLKPGGYLLSFGSPRLHHRMISGVEDAGFEIRDCIAWLYGSGFPKSLDVSKAIDKAAGAEREVAGPDRGRLIGDSDGASTNHGRGGVRYGAVGASAPATDLAARWQGFGTALKPALEPIVVARKPLVGTVAANVEQHGCGALNIDGCRIPHDGTGAWGTINRNNTRGVYGSFGDENGNTPGSRRNVAGRWPANVVLDEDAAAMLDEQTGTLGNAHRPNRVVGQRVAQDRRTYDGGIGKRLGSTFADSGGASRFFYCAKSSRAERNAGLGDMPERAVATMRARGDDPAGEVDPVSDRFTTVKANHHPTVKPIALMRWLVRLVTPPGGTVLDPFAGSGTTGCAAALEGFAFIGAEQDAEYVEIARRRIAYHATIAAEERDKQLDMFAEVA